MATMTMTATPPRRLVTWKKIAHRGSRDASGTTSVGQGTAGRLGGEESSSSSSPQRRESADTQKSLAMATLRRRRVSPAKNADPWETSTTQRVHFDLDKNTVAEIPHDQWVPPEVTWHTRDEYEMIQNGLVEEMGRLRERLLATSTSGWYDDSMAASLSQQERIDSWEDQHFLCHYNGELHHDKDDIFSTSHQEECTIRGLEAHLRSPTDRDGVLRRRASLVTAVLRIQTMHERRQTRMVLAFRNHKRGFATKSRGENATYTKSIADACKLRSLRDRRVAVQAARVDADFVRKSLRLGMPLEP